MSAEKDQQKLETPSTGNNILSNSVIERRYNPIFEKLVEDEKTQDLVGLVAYGLYKNDKRNWIVRYREKHNQYPGSQELDAYVEHLGDEELERLRTEAEGLMLRFADEIVASKASEIRENALSGSLLKALQSVEKKASVKRQFGWNILASICGSIVVIILGIILVAGIYQPGIIDIFSDVFGQ